MAFGSYRFPIDDERIGNCSAEPMFAEERIAAQLIELRDGAFYCFPLSTPSATGPPSRYVRCTRFLDCAPTRDVSRTDVPQDVALDADPCPVGGGAGWRRPLNHERKSLLLHPFRHTAAARATRCRRWPCASEKQLVMNRWKRFGKDRLYVQNSGGVRIGFWDLVTDTGHPESPEDMSKLQAAVAKWQAERCLPSAVDPPRPPGRGAPHVQSAPEPPGATPMPRSVRARSATGTGRDRPRSSRVRRSAPGLTLPRISLVARRVSKPGPPATLPL